MLERIGEIRRIELRTFLPIRRGPAVMVMPAPIPRHRRVPMI